MISEGTKKFDLYDFFSVFLPGSLFILGLVPFLPQSIVFNTAFLVPLLVGGFVVGRGLHAVAIELEDKYSETPTHREQFVEEVLDPSFLTEDTVEQFRTDCAKEFDAIADPSELENDSPDRQTIEDAYVLVRSYVHMDARGRSRTFQAIYSFFRSTWIASLVLATLYYGYAVLKSLKLFTPYQIYTSVVGEVQIPVMGIALGSAATVGIAHRVFGEGRKGYQKFFVQYLIADFLVLQHVDRPDAIVTAENLRELEDD